MTETLDARAKKIIDTAIEMSGAEREAFVGAACGSDAELRARVQRLLAASEEDDLFLRAPTLGAGKSGGGGRLMLAEESPGAMIGPYRVLELIGEGGFGSVYLAEQSEPVRRRVALKIIKLGMDTRAVVGRFEQERQALAVMDHPNIAKVLDAGATQSGRPYFVMEMVNGEPITTFCDAKGLTIPQRLELFRQVCLAVHHAHTKGIIHRDIKPGNVLVVEQDGRPTCRVIDFGIAKATQRPLTEKTVFTEFRQLVGTPEYMSPEQASGSLDVDTRSDVYSLGVLLYEMLAGVTPLDPGRLRSAAFGEMQRMIREEDPPAPSTRLTGSMPTLASVAARRKIEPRQLGATIRGELDWIVMRALEKDRSRRYDSPGSMEADIGRYLTGEPVTAAPPGAGYRLRKLARRHRGVVVATGLVALALVAGLTATAWQARVAARERDAARVAADVAERRSRETEQVARFQAVQLASIDPRTMGEKVRADILENVEGIMLRDGATAEQIRARREQLLSLMGDVNYTDIALRTLDRNYFERAIVAARREFRDQPLVRAELLLSIGSTMRDLGLLQGAASPLIEALAIRRRELGDDHRLTIGAITSLGVYRMTQGASEEGEGLLREATERSERSLGPEHPVTLNVRNNAALQLFNSSKLDEAERMFTSLVADRRRVSGSADKATGRAIANLATVLAARGRVEEATPLWREAVDIFRQASGDDDFETVQAVMNLTGTMNRFGRFQEAIPLMRECIQKMRRMYGEEHRNTILAKRRLGQALLDAGEFEEGEKLEREMVASFTRSMGADHAETLEAKTDLGKALLRLGRQTEAVACLRESLAGQERRFGGDALPTTLTRHELGIALIDAGSFAEAEAELRRVERVLNDSGHGTNVAVHRALARAYEGWEKAEPGQGHAAAAAIEREKISKEKAPADP